MSVVADPEPGDVIEARYELRRQIGHGAHGNVFEAYDREAGLNVAVKVLKHDVSEDPQFAVRLWREAQSLEALWGSSVVQVYGYGHDLQNDFVYMVMELLHGETLSQHLAGLEIFSCRMSPYRLLEALDPVARALHTAHSKGIIHRDIKPSNIMLLHEELGGGTRLMDFGLAKVYGSMDLTQAGMVAGSPSYISPEVWKSKPFDHRIDVYSFAAVVFRALSGRPPFLGESVVDILVGATTAARPDITEFRPEFPAETNAWFHKALAIESDDRFPYVSTMWNEFIRLVMGIDGPSGTKARASFSFES